jgi:hypothetical protein
MGAMGCEGVVRALVSSIFAAVTGVAMLIAAPFA